MSASPTSELVAIPSIRGTAVASVPSVEAPALEIVREHRRAAGRRRGWLVRRALLLADLAGLVAAFLVQALLFGSGESGRVDLASETLLFVVTLPFWVVVAKMYGLYERDEERTDHTTVDDLVGVFHLVTIGTWFFFAGAWLTRLAEPGLPKLAALWAIAIALVTLARSGARALCRRSPAYLQKTVIVGAGKTGRLIARKFLRHPEYGISVVGFVDDGPAGVRVEGVPLLGPAELLPAIVRAFDAERVVIAFSIARQEWGLDVVRSLRDLDVQVDVVPRLFQVVGPSPIVHSVEGLPLVGLLPSRLSRSDRLLKRTMDVLIAASMLAVLAPAFAAIALLIKLDSRGPVFFRQVRMGSGGKTFRIFKFRTMVEDAEEEKGALQPLNVHVASGDSRMFKIPDDPRVTRVGRVLRRYSLDEFPQLINVVRGEMSLVGPRPLILDEDRHVRDWARKRLDLKPGMTGLWQVLGRSEIPFGEMVNLDYRYVTTWSVWNDVRLLLRTLPLVLRGGRAAY